jgi:hypothetical protein
LVGQAKNSASAVIQVQRAFEMELVQFAETYQPWCRHSAKITPTILTVRGVASESLDFFS